jgi:sec-independent protein translocase protein TatB
MGNLSLSEIVVIVLVILVVFGPERLPEMARKAGQLVRKARGMVTDLRQEYGEEWDEVTKPLKDVQSEIMGIKTDLESSMASLNDDIARAKKEVEQQMSEAKRELEAKLSESESAAQGTPAEAAKEADDSATQGDAADDRSED